MPSKGQKIQGSEKTRSNGAVTARFLVKKQDGSTTVVTRWVKSSKNIMAKSRASRSSTGRPVITASQAQAAFNRFYKRTQHKRRGTKGKFFASSKGRLSAMKYDKNHTGKRVVSDSRYLTASGPYRYDFQGVDTGSKVRAALSSNQLKVLKAARDKLAAKLAALRKPKRVLPVKPKRVLPVKTKRMLPATPKSSVKPKRVLPATPKAACKVQCRQKAAQKAGSQKAGSQKAGSQKAGSQKAGSQKAGSQKAGSQKAGSQKAGSQKAGSQKAGSQKAGSQKAGSQKAGSQKAGSQKAGSQKAGSQKAGSQKAGSQKAGSQKAGSQKAGSQKAGSQKAGSQKAGSQKAGGKVTGTFSVPRQVAGYWW